MSISANFKREEFACKCGCGFDTVDFMLLESLEAIRHNFDSPVTVNSGCRCVAHNEAVDGSSVSQHLVGRAADIVVEGKSPDAIAEYAESLGLSVGRYATFTHVDTRTNGPSFWDNRPQK